MSWRDLLAPTVVVAPWVGGRFLCRQAQRWELGGRFPDEHGWYLWEVQGRAARLVEKADPVPDLAIRESRVSGYLVGDRLISDTVNANQSPNEVLAAAQRVRLVEPGLDRFVRVSAAQFWCEGPYLFESVEFPLGSELGVEEAYLEQQLTVADVLGVTPALEAAFRIEVWLREEAERQRRVAEEVRAREEARQQMVRLSSDACGRRELARHDFAAAARAALAVGGAVYLAHRIGYNAHERAVQFRFRNRRFECVCDAATLRIVDAGICLTSARGRFDEFFTLESLPSVIAEGDDTSQLVVLRNV
jgi:hypothetical protein